ncbi:MAG: S8 family peptidase [Fervidobacterium sp.]
MNYKNSRIFILIVITLVITMFFSCTKNASSDSFRDRQTYEAQEKQQKRIIIGYEKYDKALMFSNLLGGEVVLHIPELKVLSIEVEDTAEKVIQRAMENDDFSKYNIRYIEPVQNRYLEPECEDVPGLKSVKDLKDLKVNISEFVYNSYENYTGESLDLYLWNHRVVGIKDAWDNGYNGEGIVIAVLDTGVDGTNPDLEGQVTIGYRPKYDEILPEETDSSYGGSHGTHVAGIIAAKKDGVGIVGVAPRSKIMPIVIFEANGAYVGDDYTARGIVWAVEHGAKVLSNSWGGYGYSQVLKDAFDYALNSGVTVVVAAGNSTASQTFQYPANYPGIIQVGAAEFNGGNVRTANFSSGSPMITLSAPGRNILSTMPQYGSKGYTGDSFKINENGGYYGFMSGTSMATPYVAGLVALILQKYPTAKPWQVRKILEKSAKDIDFVGIDDRSGYGLAQAKALDETLPITGGSNFVVNISDHYGLWKIPGVYVSLVGTSDDGRFVRYFSKTNKDGQAKFLGIDEGTYDIFVGGPDSFESSRGLSKECYRVQEERYYSFAKKIRNEDESLDVHFNSMAFVTFDSTSYKPKRIVFQNVTKPATDSEAFIYVDFSSLTSYDFSKLSGKYNIFAQIDQPATNDITLSGKVILNGFEIPISGTITKGELETQLKDKIGKWWTVFGND